MPKGPRQWHLEAETAPARPHLKIVQIRMAKYNAEKPKHPQVKHIFGSVYKEPWGNVENWPGLERGADRVEEDTELWKTLQIVKGKWA